MMGQDRATVYNFTTEIKTYYNQTNATLVFDTSSESGNEESATKPEKPVLYNKKK